jgi:hypothetical protein
MNKELKNKWISALRSGNYQQARGALILATRGSDARYCCLGVLLCVSGQYRAPQIQDVADHYDRLDEFVGDAAERAELAMLNDYRNKSFAQIADHIEKRL